MDEDEVLENIREVVAEQVGADIKDLPDVMSLTSLGMDDLDRAEIANELEEALSIELPENEHLGWQALGDVYNSVKSALRTQEASVPR